MILPLSGHGIGMFLVNLIHGFTAKITLTHVGPTNRWKILHYSTLSKLNKATGSSDLKLAVKSIQIQHTFFQPCRKFWF